MQSHISDYSERLISALNSDTMQRIPVLAKALRDAWQAKKCIYLCGNGGSAGNAVHLANDLLYGVGVKSSCGGMKVEALSANPAVLTCLGNDIGYDKIYAEQIRVKGGSGDLLIVLSGSGNSPNIVQALEAGNRIGMTTFAILGYSGGKCKALAMHAIHFAIDDMQIAEDMQLVVGHMCMQWLMVNPPVQGVAP